MKNNYFLPLVNLEQLRWLGMLILINMYKVIMEVLWNVVNFGVDNNSSMDTDNRRKDILIFGEGPIGGLDDTSQERILFWFFTKIKPKFFVC